MPTTNILTDTGSARDGSSVALLRIPFVFTQDKLLSTGDFISEAKERGYSLALKDLESLYRHRLLTPMFRIGDIEVESRRIDVTDAAERNTRGRVFEAARIGRICDSASEELSAEWPFALPEGELDRGWWNGFLYSWWQLPDLKMALRDLSLINQGHIEGIDLDRVDRDRCRSIALAALATKYLPGILGSMTLPSDKDAESLWAFKHDTEVADLLQVAGFDKERLRSEAITLLQNARARDPMKEWWPLIRHSNKGGWEKLAGVTRDCIWQRIAAEILLRAHEELAARTQVDPLEDLTGYQVFHPLHDRVSPREAEVEPIARVLATYGLSPHPRVLLLLEGQTEMVHVPALLSEWGLNQPDRVRIQNCRGADVNPQLISRYAITPQLGPVLGGIQTLLPPTALYIGMDPEGRFWRSPQQREKAVRNIQKAIREDVEAQGAVVLQEELDFLVNTFVWGEDSYEIANFRDDELVSAVTHLAVEQSNDLVSESNWEANLRIALERARAKHLTLQKVIGHSLHVREDKPRLAEILLPVLVMKYEQELASGKVTTPVFRLVEDVQRLHSLMSVGEFALKTKPVKEAL